MQNIFPNEDKWELASCIVANFLTKMMSSLLHLNFCQSMHISGLRPSPFSPAWFLPITVINLQIDYRVQQCFAYLHHWGSQVKECRTCCNSEALLLCNPLLFLTSVSINRSRLKKITRLPVHCLSSCWTSKRTLWQKYILVPKITALAWKFNLFG